MKRRPKRVWISSGLFFLAGLLVLIGEAPPWLCWIIPASGLLTALLTLQTSAFLLTLVPSFLGLCVWHSLNIFPALSEMDLAVNTLPLAAALLGALPLLTQNFRQLISNPKKRWWVPAKRTVISLGTRISPVTGGEVLAQSFDLSETGVFVSLKNPILREETLPNLTIGSHCALRINLNQYTYLACTGQIVRSTTGSGNYPVGVGIRFVGLTRHQRNYLSSYLKNPPASENLTSPISVP